MPFPTIKALVESKLPLFGICLGHQMLSLALGAKTHHMAQGHHGANHPVKDLETGKVEIVSMNHGFTVDRDTLAQGREGNAHLAVRQDELRLARRRPRHLLGAVSSRGLARPAGFALSFRALREGGPRLISGSIVQTERIA